MPATAVTGQWRDEHLSDPTRCKVGSVAVKYSLEDVCRELEQYWTGERGDGRRHSLRKLATYFNRNVLLAALDEEDERLSDGEVGRLALALQRSTEDGTDHAESAEELRRRGVDVDSLRSDFVSHQAVHTYLKKYRDVDSPDRQDHRDDVDRRTRNVRKIERLNSRSSAVASDALEVMRNAGEIAVGDLEVRSVVWVRCRDCGGRFRFDELVSRTTCECPEVTA